MRINSSDSSATSSPDDLPLNSNKEKYIHISNNENVPNYIPLSAVKIISQVSLMIKQSRGCQKGIIQDETCKFILILLIYKHEDKICMKEYLTKKKQKKVSKDSYLLISFHIVL